jgi:hypothetical protein
MTVMCLYNYRKVLAAISLAWLRHFFLNIKKSSSSIPHKYTHRHAKTLRQRAHMIQR